MTKATSAFLVLAGALIVSGCQSNNMAEPVGLPAASSFGSAVRNDIAVETVNPNAPSDAPLLANGATTAAAVDRYVHGAVIAPADTGTSSAGGGGTGMSAGGSK